MNIALDFDGTYTADPGLWSEFIKSARRRGHKVIVCTMRYESEGDDVYRQLHEKVDQIVFTSRKAKGLYMAQQAVPIHIWIDDMPHFIVSDSAGAVWPEGA